VSNLLIHNRIERTALAVTMLAALLLISSGTTARAQEDTISRNPNAVKLNRIWTRQGWQGGYQYVGRGVAALGDINADGLADFAVEHRDSVEVFLGARPVPTGGPFQTKPTTEVFIREFISPIGDFWGTGRKAVVLSQKFDLVVYRTESGRLADSPATRWRHVASENHRRYLGAADAGDIDNDGYDDLAIITTSLRLNNVPEYRAEIRLYRGGPDFSLDSADHVIRDTELNDGVNSYVKLGDLDKDGHLDIVMLARYPDHGAKLKIWFGDGTVDGFRDSADRSGFNTSFTLHLLDTDGDGASDILIDGGYLFRSGSGKDARTRSYAPEDADQTFLGDGFLARSLGPLNDNAGRYSMVGKGPVVLHAYSGGPEGPDRAWEAYYYATADGFIIDKWDFHNAVLGDVNGDGWSDIIFGDDEYPSASLPYGLAIILTGGAYIPRDGFEPSAIVDVSDGRMPDAVTIWPVPATDVLNIAWRGDLASAPSSIAITDALGRVVHRENVLPVQSHATWRCSGMPTGTYLLTLLDSNLRVIASGSVVKY
jgi:hypothetical protein